MAPQTIAFFGASTGVGLSVLKTSLAEGSHCIALCRDPSKLTTVFPNTSNLEIIEGNIHDTATIARCLRTKEGRLVDGIVFTIGSKPKITYKIVSDDPTVCGAGMTKLIQTIAQLRSEGVTGQPWIVAVSTTGMSKYGRDYPLALFFIYKVLLSGAHEDKRVMEEALIDSGEDFTVVRCSLLTNGASDAMVRAGIEGPKTGLESKVIGYTISREDAGKWIAQNVMLGRDPKYLKKTASITY
ncbi:hypothetical protein MMC25_006234 [Agyrium rufum]|nr:hypothetical protein [Agyrium rufum]